MTTSTDNEIKQTRLFIQLCLVLDESVALNLLKSTYTEYIRKDDMWNWDEPLGSAIVWDDTKQGYEWWCKLADAIDNKINNKP